MVKLKFMITYRNVACYTDWNHRIKLGCGGQGDKIAIKVYELIPKFSR